MRFPEDAPVTPEKRTALKERLARLGIALEEVDEKAVKGSGPGGQKVNKTSSGVLLRYLLRVPGSPSKSRPGPAPEPEQLTIKWTRERHHALNRFLALRELADEVEARISPETSERLRAAERTRKQKDRARRRSASKSGPENSEKPPDSAENAPNPPNSSESEP